jgi:hypothetical protein
MTTIHSLFRLATVAAFAAAASAAVPALVGAQVIDGCYAPKTGSVYRIKAEGTPTQCSKGHTQFSWNVQGPKGDKGDQGAVGPQGPAGGLAGVEYVQAPTQVLPANTAQQLVVSCPFGKVALSGGYWTTGEDPLLAVTFSMPSTSQYGPVGWTVKLVNYSSSQRLAFVWVTCATRGS